jgi:hypothetical protein
MSKHDYPTAVTVAHALKTERRGVTWSKEAIELANQNLLAAAKDIPDTPEYADVRRAVYRALDRLRQARGALTTAHDAVTEALMIAGRCEPAYVTSDRLLERYGGQRGANGATQVRNARKERERREAEYSERERWKQEMERQRFLGEGMREGLD